MHLTPSLSRKIDDLLFGVSPKALEERYARLSTRYRSRPSGGTHFGDQLDFLAYLVARFPATYAVVSRVLEEVKDLPVSVLDLGAGPATGLLAVLERFGTIESATLVERESEWKRIGTHLLQGSNCHVTWKQGELASVKVPQTHDIVLLSYVIGELGDDAQRRVIDQAWDNATQTLVIIEPGTPEGFARILKARQYLLEKGGYILAPCPHHNPCPMAGNDWCHFSQRIERSAFHRQVKGAALSTEDEKFSYLIGTKTPHDTPEARIVCPPCKTPHAITHTVCTSTGLRERIVTKKEKAIFKHYKKAQWGDPL